MTAPETIRQLTEKGIRLEIQGDQIHVKAPKGVLTDEVRVQIRSIKRRLIEQCDRCRNLEARGVSVLQCRDCDAVEKGRSDKWDRSG